MRGVSVRQTVFVPVLKIQDGETRTELGADLQSRSPGRMRPNVLRYRDDLTPMAIAPNIITADQVNCLIYSYLKDSGTLKVLYKKPCSNRVGLGFHHAAFAIKSEGHLDRSPNFTKHIPRGELVDLLSKALLYIEIETHWSAGSLTLDCRTPFSLLDKHTCDIGAIKSGTPRIPPESTTKPAPPVEDDDEGTPRRVEEDGMDVDSQAEAQAETSADSREQKHEVPGVQLYDGSKSTVCYPSSLVLPRFLF